MFSKLKPIKLLIVSSLLFLQCLFVTSGMEIDEWQVESDIPLEKCNLQTIVNFYYFSNVKKQSEFASISLKLNDETLKLIENLPSKTKSVGEQFTKEQYSKFNENRNNKMTVGLKQLLESNRARDIDALNHMVQIADKNFRFNTEIYDKKNTEFIHQETLKTLRALDVYAPLKEQAKIDEKQCSVNLALAKLQNEPYKIVMNDEADKNIDLMQLFVNKHGGKQIDRQKLSASERKYFDELTLKVDPIKRAAQYYQDLTNLMMFNQSSVQIYKSGKRDFELYGNSDGYGTTLKEVKASKDADKRNLMTINLIENFDKFYPSEYFLQMKKLADYAKSVGSK